jgi:hypothetical protein
MYKFFKDISEQPAHFSNTNVHKTQEITAKTCDVHRSTVKKVCNEAFNSSSDNQVFDSPRKSYKRKHDDADMNNFHKYVLCQTVYEFYDKGKYPIASKLTGFYGSQSNIKTIKENGFQIQKM